MKSKGGIVWSKDIDCSGIENKLQFCDFKGSSRDCSHDQDVTVVCNKRMFATTPLGFIIDN